MGLFDAFRAPRPPPEESAPSAEILGGEVLQEQASASTSTSELLSNHEARLQVVLLAVLVCPALLLLVCWCMQRQEG